jgi:hypothetical protein
MKEAKFVLVNEQEEVLGLFWLDLSSMRKARRSRKIWKKRRIKRMTLVEPEVFGAIEYCLGEEGCFIGMHHCIGRGIEEENLVVSESNSLDPVRLRVLLQALVQEIGENCWNELMNKELETRGGELSDLYQYLSHKEERYWTALFDGYAETAPKFEKIKLK